MKTSGVYIITNIVNNKKYIGSSNNLQRRRATHFRQLRLGKHHNSSLQASYNKYGAANFSFNILEIVKEKQLLDREQFYLDLYGTYYNNKGFNVCKEAASTKGFKWSKSLRKRMSKQRAGKSFHTEYQLQRIKETNSGKGNNMFGKVYTEEEKQHRREVLGYKVTQIHPDTKKIIKVWDSMQQAANGVKRHISCIRDCCIGKQKKAAGFIWKLV